MLLPDTPHSSLLFEGTEVLSGKVLSLLQTIETTFVCQGVLFWQVCSAHWTKVRKQVPRVHSFCKNSASQNRFKLLLQQNVNLKEEVSLWVYSMCQQTELFSCTKTEKAEHFVSIQLPCKFITNWLRIMFQVLSHFNTNTLQYLDLTEKSCILSNN